MVEHATILKIPVSCMITSNYTFIMHQNIEKCFVRTIISLILQPAAIA